MSEQVTFDAAVEPSVKRGHNLDQSRRETQLSDGSSTSSSSSRLEWVFNAETEQLNRKPRDMIFDADGKLSGFYFTLKVFLPEAKLFTEPEYQASTDIPLFSLKVPIFLPGSQDQTRTLVKNVRLDKRVLFDRVFRTNKKIYTEVPWRTPSPMASKL